MAEPRAPYTQEEDALILSIVEEVKAESLPLTTAYIKAADELGRPVKSVTNRHRRLMGTGDIKYHSKNLSIADKLTLKLKSLSRESERNAEKSDMYKEKYDKLSAEFNVLRREYRNLELEHAKLVQVISDVLGEKDDNEKGATA